ncbi:hypothetical protein B0F90DRAFT_1763002 [Multifurca ochricompacta]|uniref:Uncharacterized protein n=1 Tax=Multifurca ochricompacta TaxID=376703 RepID=A0AAD4LYG1_9AGAM|nr:hypothetical protein B0F90DRAFT_1763002 [Multifurca ochricompacta]
MGVPIAERPPSLPFRSVECKWVGVCLALSERMDWTTSRFQEIAKNTIRYNWRVPNESQRARLSCRGFMRLVLPFHITTKSPSPLPPNHAPCRARRTSQIKSRNMPNPIQCPSFSSGNSRTTCFEKNLTHTFKCSGCDTNVTNSDETFPDP